MGRRTAIPFCDLRRQARSLGREIQQAVRRVCTSGAFILGPEVEAFEREFAAYCGSREAVGVASGTEALQIALLACGIQRGDEVMTVANAGVPTVAAIVLAGAVPAFVDIAADTYTMDASRVAAQMTSRTKAILPVHLYGQCAEMQPLLDLAKRRQIHIVEDACQAHGAMDHGRHAGTLGTVGCFSFYPTKNLGAYGDGGMIVTNDATLAARARRLRNYGARGKEAAELCGLNSRLDELHAAMLRVKSPHLDRWNERRRTLAAHYERRLTNPLVKKPRERPDAMHVYHLYVIACDQRDALRAFLLDRGIQTLVHYPLPAYAHPAYADSSAAARCPRTEAAARQVLSLPLYPELRDDEVREICRAVNAFSP